MAALSFSTLSLEWRPSSKPRSFLDLPLELRNIVYAYLKKDLFPPPANVVCYASSKEVAPKYTCISHPAVHTKGLAICRQVRAELLRATMNPKLCLDMRYGYPDVVVDTFRHICDQMDPDFKSKLRSLTVRLDLNLMEPVLGKKGFPDTIVALWGLAGPTSSFPKLDELLIRIRRIPWLNDMCLNDQIRMNEASDFMKKRWDNFGGYLIPYWVYMEDDREFGSNDRMNRSIVTPARETLKSASRQMESDLIRTRKYDSADWSKCTLAADSTADEDPYAAFASFT